MAASADATCTAIAPPIDEPSKKTGPGWALGVAAAVAARMPSTIKASELSM